jgi:phage FluMu gp28-like protein
MRRRGNAKIAPSEPKRVFLPYQQAWIDDQSRLKIMQKSRQIGLSWASAYACCERTAPRENKNDQWVSSRDDIQARLFLEDCKRFASMLDTAARDLGAVIIDEEKRISAYVLQFANGKRIHSMSSNPDAQAGKRGGRVLDEFALHPDPRKLYSIAYPGITWGGQLEIISTHRGSANFFNELVEDVQHKANPKGFSLHTVSLQNALDQGFLYKLQQALPERDERLEMDEAEYFDFIRKGCASEEIFLQEYMCIPADDAGAFLSYDLIAGCEYRADEPWEMYSDGHMPDGRKLTELYVGVDVGRARDLTVFWVIERVGGVMFTRRVTVLQNMPFSSQEAELYALLELPGVRRCCIDDTGLGMQFAERAREKYGDYKVEGVRFTAPVKEALAYPVRAAFEDKSVRIPRDDKIRADLRAIKKTTTAAGNIRFDAERTGDGHCYDDQTDVLTAVGWKRFCDLTLQDEVAALSGADLVYQKPLEIQRQPYSGEMIQIQNKQIDLCVTPNHRIYVRDRSGWRFMLAAEIVGWPGKKIEFSKAARWNGRRVDAFRVADANINADLWLEFMGYFIAQGFTSTQNRSGVYAKDIESTPIKPCVEKLPFGFWIERNAENGMASYRSKHRGLHAYLFRQGKSWERFIPRDFLDLDKPQLQVLFDAMMYGNGCKAGSWKYRTTSYRLASDMQELCLKLGMCGSIATRQMSLNGKNKRKIFEVNINRTRLTPVINKRRKSWSIIDYQGEVFCCTVPAGIVYVRRGGKCCWCGNSDRFWSLALAVHAAGTPAGPIEFESTGIRREYAKMGGYFG